MLNSAPMRTTLNGAKKFYYYSFKLTFEIKLCNCYCSILNILLKIKNR